MSMLRRITNLFQRSKLEQEIEAELHSHIEMRVADNVAAGMPLEEARRDALLRFGNRAAMKERVTEAEAQMSLDSLWQDLRYGVRMLRRSPGFTAVAVLTLALGIGANTAIFSVVYGVLLRPLPYRDASRLVQLNETTLKVGTVSVSYPNFLDWRAQNHAFARMAAVNAVDFNLGGISQPENISGEAVSPNFLSLLGVRPFLGRDFDPSEEKARTAPVVLLSYALWESHLGGDRNVVGRTITLDGRAFTIIGVLPPDFRSVDRTDVLEPIGVWAGDNSEEATSRGDRGDAVAIGRLAPGVSFAEARAEMEGIAARLAQEYPATNDRFGAKLQPIRNVFVGDLRPAILVLFTAVVFVLLVACVNVANLFLVRGAARAKEMALRIALGASRGRIIRQMLTESFALAILGGALGVALALAGMRGMTRLIPSQMLAGATVNLNGGVLLFTGGIVVLCAFVFGLAPGAHSAKHDTQAELKEGGRTLSANAGQNRLRSVLAVAEISIALILLAGAGLMMRSLYRLLSVNPGFQANRVLSMRMDLRTQQYAKDPAILNFWQEVLDRVRALPGVERAAVGTVVPLTGNHSRADITIEGMPPVSIGNYPHPDYHKVSPGYLSTLGIPLLSGRAFSEGDRENTLRVGIINATLAERFFPRGDAVGKRFRFGRNLPDDKAEWITIVGVVGDTKLYGLANPARLEVYIPYRQAASSVMSLLVKSSVEPAAMISVIRSEVASVDKDQPIFDISTMNRLVSDDVSTQRVTLALLGAFSGLALALATIGIYGVISYSVAQRTREIGIRMALGAHRGSVMGMVLGQAGKIALAGIGIGVAASLGLMRLMRSLLFSVSASDPLTFATVVILVAGVALLAGYIPARRAMRVDPMVALRYE